MIATLDLTRPIGVRDRALLLLGFAGCFHRSELPSLDVGDIAKHRDGLLVTLARSKTDQEAEGVEKGIPYGAHSETCPVRALDDCAPQPSKSARTRSGSTSGTPRYSARTPPRRSDSREFAGRATYLPTSECRTCATAPPLAWSEQHLTLSAENLHHGNRLQRGGAAAGRKDDLPARRAVGSACIVAPCPCLNLAEIVEQPVVILVVQIAHRR